VFLNFLLLVESSEPLINFILFIRAIGAWNSEKFLKDKSLEILQKSIIHSYLKTKVVETVTVIILFINRSYIFIALSVHKIISTYINSKPIISSKSALKSIC